MGYSRLIGLICDCGSSLPLFRQFLQGHQFPDYMKVPVYRGNEARRVADNLRDESLSLYLSVRSTFVIIALLTGDPQAPTVEWVDINNAKLPQQLEAKALLEKA